MAKGRMINRTIALSRKVSKCTRTEQWFYFRLMPFVDDEGRLPGDLFKLKNLCFPAESLSETEIRKFLLKLHDVNLVKFAENHVVELVMFTDNQKIGHRPAKSLYPEYQEVIGKGEERLTRCAGCKPALDYIKLDLKDRGCGGKETVYRDIQGLILTVDEYNKLVEKHTKVEVDEVIEAMDNKAGLKKKYVSAYKTANNWLNLGKKRQVESAGARSTMED